MLLQRENSILLLVDVQEKLTPLVQESELLIERCSWLMQVASSLQIPQLSSMQHPAGLGPIVPELCSAHAVYPKEHFSCWRDLPLQAAIQSLNRKQIILIGIETHICILQTALDLLNAQYEVFVVIDAVSSRKKIDYRYGLKRIKQAGGQLVTHEMIFF